MSIEKLPVYKTPLDKKIGLLLGGCEMNYARRKAIFGFLVAGGLIEKMGTYRGTVEQNMALLDCIKRQLQKVNLRVSAKKERKTNALSTRKQMEALRKEASQHQATAPQRATTIRIKKKNNALPAVARKNPQTNVPKQKNALPEINVSGAFPKHREKIESTLRVAKSKMPLLKEFQDSFESDLASILEKLFIEKASKLSPAAFDRECTKARKRVMHDYFMKMRQRISTASNEEFRKLIQQNGLRRSSNGKVNNGKIRRMLGIQKTGRRGVSEEDINFLDKKVANNKTYHQVFQTSIKSELAKQLPHLKPKQQKEVLDTLIKIHFGESRGDPFAISPSYCIGISQSSSVRWDKSTKKGGYNPWNPVESIRASAREFVLSIERWSKKVNLAKALQLATAEHNAGLGDVMRAFRKSHAHWQRYLARGESRRYVSDIEKRYRYWKRKLGRDPLAN